MCAPPTDPSGSAIPPRGVWLPRRSIRPFVGFLVASNSLVGRVPSDLDDDAWPAGDMSVGGTCLSLRELALESVLRSFPVANFRPVAYRENVPFRICTINSVTIFVSIDP